MSRFLIEKVVSNILFIYTYIHAYLWSVVIFKIILLPNSFSNEQLLRADL